MFETQSALPKAPSGGAPNKWLKKKALHTKYVYIHIGTPSNSCHSYFFTVGYTTDTILFKWIEPKEKAVEFDKTGQEQPESVVNTDVLLEDCSYNDTSGNYELLLLQCGNYDIVVQ